MCNALASFGLLLMRLAAAGMMAVGHGWPKFQQFEELSKGFPDPLNVGHKTSLIFAILGELVCPALVAVGLLTRLATLGAVTTMVVALCFVHAQDPLFMPRVEFMKDAGAKEMAIMYLIPFATLFFTGPGKLSIDGLIFRRRKAVISTPVLKKA